MNTYKMLESIMQEMGNQIEGLANISDSFPGMDDPHFAGAENHATRADGDFTHKIAEVVEKYLKENKLEIFEKVVNPEEYKDYYINRVKFTVKKGSYTYFISIGCHEYSQGTEVYVYAQNKNFNKTRKISDYSGRIPISYF